MYPAPCPPAWGAGILKVPSACLKRSAEMGMRRSLSSGVIVEKSSDGSVGVAGSLFVVVEKKPVRPSIAGEAEGVASDWVESGEDPTVVADDDCDVSTEEAGADSVASAAGAVVARRKAAEVIPAIVVRIAKVDMGTIFLHEMRK